jgi:exopolysaccharide biosynthesis polyprenyl glycosylphosphotransferase
MRKRLLLKPILALVDIAILVSTFLLAYWLRFELSFLPERPIPSFELYFRFSFLVALIGFGMLHASGLYRLRHLSFRIEDFFAIFRAVSFTALITMATNFILRGYIAGGDIETYSRLIILIAWLTSLVLLTLWRMGVALVLKQLRRWGRGLRNVVIVGADPAARGFYRAVKEAVDFEYRPLGLVYYGVEPDEKSMRDLTILGSLQDLPGIIRDQPVNEVVLACMDMDNETLAQLIKTCERTDVQFSMIPGFFEILTRQMSMQEVAGIPVFQLEERIFQRWGRLVKRGMDIFISLLVLVPFSPLWGLIALGVKMNSKGGVFYNHSRVGKGEKVFQMCKFRSMFADADMRRRELEQRHVSEDALLRLPEDARVTSFGRVLRRFSLDEIPQLINVLKGEMSLVGPRPHILSEVAHYHEWHKRKFDVLPGITGLTQVSGRKNLSLDEMVRLDIYYIENWSPWLDMQILIKTVPAILVGRGAY